MVQELNMAEEYDPRAYVGPTSRYDFMGASQFRLLCTLGLRADDYLLDFGCGALRAGKLFINYLGEERYFGVDPNQWLIENAIEHEVGADLVRLKKPRFDHNSEFQADVFGTKFDYILAQSIFSHTSLQLAQVALSSFEKALKPKGLAVVTFIEGTTDFQGEGWIYPDCVKFRRQTIEQLARGAGLYAVRLPWYHPRQTWYVLAKEKQYLPSRAMMKQLSGGVLFDPQFRDSWNTGAKVKRWLRAHAGIIPQSIRKPIKRLMRKA